MIRFGLTQNLWTRVLGGKSKRHLFVAWIREGNLEQLKKHDLTFADLVKNAGTQSDLIMLVHSCIANGLYEMSQGEKILQEFYKLWQTTKFTTDDYNRTELHWEMMCLVPGVEDKIKVAKLDDKQLGMLLVFASFYGLIRCVDILLKKGADVNFFSSPKNPMFPRENIHYRVGQALSFFNSYIVLSDEKMNLRFGYLPISWAIFTGNVAMYKFLKAHGADFDSRGLHIAILNNRSEMFAELLTSPERERVAMESYKWPTLLPEEELLLPINRLRECVTLESANILRIFKSIK